MSDFLRKAGFEYRGRRGSRKAWRKTLNGNRIWIALAAIIAAPMLFNAVFHRSYYDNYIERDLFTEIGSHVRGGVYTVRVTCSGKKPEILVYRAFGHEDALSYLSETRPECEVSRLLFGAHKYHNGRWVRYVL